MAGGTGVSGGRPETAHQPASPTAALLQKAQHVQDIVELPGLGAAEAWVPDWHVATNVICKTDI